MNATFATFKQTITEFGQDKAPRLGAALAYYTVFSIAPLLLIAISIAGLVFGDEAARSEISGQLGGLMGPSTAKSLEEMVQAAAKPKSGTIATIIGIVTLLFGASGVFGQLKDALNTIWNVETKPSVGVLDFVKERFLSMAMVMGVGFLLLVSLVFDAVISATGAYIERRFPGGETVMQTLQLALSFVIVTVVFAAMFKYLPDIKISWHDVWLGAIFTSILFVVGKFALGAYIGKVAASSTYGAAGSLMVLLLWVYWSAQILFFGAEFTQVYARSYGSLRGDTSKQDARSQAQRPEDRPRLETDAAMEPVALTNETTDATQHRTKDSKGGFVKVAIAGVAGVFIGALLGVVSAMAIVLKGVRKLIPFR